MNGEILVTIITTTYNSASTVRRTMESVARQTYPHIEYIIVDGASTDGTLAEIEAVRPQFNGRCRVISEPDRGMYDAMNKGIATASGSLIGILNSDDWYEPDAVERMVAQHRQHPDAVLYGILRYMENGKETMLYRMHHHSLHEGMITHPTVFVPKPVYERFGVFSIAYRLSSDYELMLRYQRSSVQFQAVDAVIANFTFGGRSTVNFDGLMENLAIRHAYGIISRDRMRWEQWKLRVKSWLKKVRISA